MAQAVMKMNEVMLFTLYGTFTGVVGTGIGGLCARFTEHRSGRFLSSILEYSAGMMLAVVLTDLLPHAFELAALPFVMTGVTIGVVFMVFMEEWTSHLQKKWHSIPRDKQAMFRMGVTMAIGIALHNLPEGLAIGGGFEANFSLGLSLALTILIHDVPEGVALAVPLRVSGLSLKKAALVAAASGIPTGIGALIGGLIGQVAPKTISLCLSLAAGAMLYVVLSDLIPQSKKLYSGRLPSFFNILGVLTGIIISICL